MEKDSLRDSVKEQGVIQIFPELNLAVAPAGIVSMTNTSVVPLVTVAQPVRIVDNKPKKMHLSKIFLITWSAREYCDYHTID
jgi:hypothetical protein